MLLFEAAQLSGGIPVDVRTLSTLIAAVIAAVASLAVAFFTRRSQSRLQESKDELDKSLTLLQDDLQRNQKYDEESRNRAVSKVSSLESAAVTLSVDAHLVPKSAWLRKKGLADLDGETVGALLSLRLNLNFLQGAGVLQAEDRDTCVAAVNSLSRRWSNVISALTPEHDEQFRIDHPDYKLNINALLDCFSELTTATRELEASLLKAFANLRLPK